MVGEGSGEMGNPRREATAAPCGGEGGGSYLFVQRRVFGATGGTALGRGHPLAGAAFQHVHAGGPSALLALEVEEHVLVEREPLLMPAARLRRLLAQVTALGAFLAGQHGQEQGMSLVVAHALLHGTSKLAAPTRVTDALLPVTFPQWAPVVEQQQQRLISAVSPAARARQSLAVVACCWRRPHAGALLCPWVVLPPPLRALLPPRLAAALRHFDPKGLQAPQPSLGRQAHAYPLTGDAHQKSSSRRAFSQAVAEHSPSRFLSLSPPPSPVPTPAGARRGAVTWEISCNRL